MRFLPRIPTTAQLRSLESGWIARCGKHWGQVLMEIAGRGAAEVAFKMWEEQPGHIAVFCGRGNNGGDGLVVARYLSLWGAPVKAYIVSNSPPQDPEKPCMNTDESNTNWRIASELGIEIAPLQEDFDNAISNSCLIVDALLGTGLDREVQGVYKEAIDAINRSGRPVFAVDLPSGINSDTGGVMGAAVRADRTVTFGYLKPGLLQHPGATLCGDLSCVDIGLPELAEGDTVHLTTADYVRMMLPSRAENSHKGTFGTVLVIAGSINYFGAAMLASETALRAGAGLSMLAAPKSLVPHLPPGEVIYQLLPETPDITISSTAIKQISEHLEKATAVIVGPGLTQNEDTVKFVYEVLHLIADAGKPCLVDADGLNAIALAPEKFPQNARDFVLTPHPKELSRLLKNSVAEVQEDRIASARHAASRFGCSVVLKGSRTVIGAADGDVYINPTGNAGMATAGAGDVLSGIIGGLLAQKMDSFDAAVCGVYIHGLAGDAAAEDLGEAGIIAGDISRAVPIAVAGLKAGVSSELESQLCGEIESD